MVWLAGVGAAILAVVLVLAALAIGSNGAPEGQVIARIGRTEITHADVEAEARAQGLASTAALSAPVVQAVIARTLLAREAERRGIQRSPAYPSDRRRADAQLLASGVLHALPSLPAPSTADVAAFIVCSSRSLRRAPAMAAERAALSRVTRAGACGRDSGRREGQARSVSTAVPGADDLEPGAR